MHGALCVAYSGQCLTSEALGGRSANRGECAQACRMPYDLISDGKQVPLGDRKYLLSPQDLAGLDILPETCSRWRGVAENRRPAQVAGIRGEHHADLPQALDDLSTAEVRETQSGNCRTPRLEPHPRSQSTIRLEMAFSRGLYTGWLGGINNQQLVHARFGKKRGVYLGEVTRVLRDAVVVQLEGPLKPGDGVVFDAGQPEETGRGRTGV